MRSFGVRKQSQGERVKVVGLNEGPPAQSVASDFCNKIDPKQTCSITIPPTTVIEVIRRAQAPVDRSTRQNQTAV